MKVDTNGLIRVLEKIQKRVRAFDERLALGCAIEAVKELDKIQAEQKGVGRVASVIQGGSK